MQKKRAGGSSSSSNRRGSSGLIGMVKQIMGILDCMVKAKSMELKSKTRELKMRLTIFWLLKDKKVLLGSTHHLSPNLQTLLTHQAPPVESTAVTQGGGGEEEVERMMRMMMSSKQGIKFVQMYNNNNNNQIVMPPVHATTPNTKTTMPILDHDYKPTATTEDKDIAYDQEEDLEQEKEQQQDKNDDDEVVDVRVKDQPWMFVEDEVTTDDGSHHCSKDGELVAVPDEDEDEVEDDDNDNINVDEAADLFIRNFRQQLRLQKNQNYYS